ncbi:site-specific integrase [Pedobacter sp.]|jgi:integrase|uniref:site-specific integrase n=1 Tax=Pedobacter sp. TaxID=1411316 RepID=UPI002C047447|nr:site-specific integrase [Pedobacter sp.]HWW39360.1 site-specific integrase [Pedobacter sp.]
MKGTVKIYLRLDKTLKNGKVPIELVYSVTNQRKYYNTGEKVFKEYWDNSIQRAFYIPLREAKKKLPQIEPDLLLTESEIDEINDNLAAIVKEIDNYEKDHLRKDIAFSSQMIIELLKESKNPSVKKEEPNNFVFDFIDQYIKDNTSTRVKGSLSVYKSLKAHLQAYETAKRTRITFSLIDYKFFQAFQNFLIERTKINRAGETSSLLNNTTIAKALSTLKTFLGYAKHHGITISDSYKSFKIKRETLEVIALTENEFETLFNFDLSNNKRLSQVRDVFCFSCATGLRYSDLSQLSREHIKAREIDLTVTKTKEKLSIPLSYYSLAILDKYKELHKPLPVISSQNMNLYVKELCMAAGINDDVEIVRFRGAKREAVVYPKHELITIHTGRKTFVTLSLERGMSTEEVMSISGHSDYRSFKRYVKVTEERKKVVMLKAWGEPEPVSKLKVVS